MQDLQHPETGVPVRTQKVFLTYIPCAFMGYDLVEWLMDKLKLEESAEAVHLANLLCNYGYFFPASDSKNLVVRDDGSLYRFQTPYFWPSNHNPDNTDYAIYLVKRSLRNKQKHGLEEYETDMYNKLRKVLAHKWEFICMQAQEQVKLAKERKKADKIVLDSQERAHWRVHRPPPGYTSALEHAPVPISRNGTKKKKTKEDLAKEVQFLKDALSRTRLKNSQAMESLLHQCEVYTDYDPFVSGAQPSNPWITEDNTLWVLNGVLVENPTEKRVKRWAISLHDLLEDATGLQAFEQYLRSEYSSENIRFWKAVEDLRLGSQTSVEKKVAAIYEEFLEPGAPCQVNLDGKTLEMTQQTMKKPNRYTFDAAQKHVFALMNKDSYPRFIRSEVYKQLVANAIQPYHKKKSIFSFGSAVKKKNSTPNAHNCISSSSSNNKQRRGSNSSDQRNLSGSSSDLQDSSGHEGRSGSPVGPFIGHHSLSTSNLHDLESTDHSCRGDLANTSKKRSTWSNLLSSPTSQEKLNEAHRGTLDVPKPFSAEVGLLETSLGLGLGLSLAVPASKKSAACILKGRRLSDDPSACSRKLNDVREKDESPQKKKSPSKTPSPHGETAKPRKKANEVCPWEDEESVDEPDKSPDECNASTNM